MSGKSDREREFYDMQHELLLGNKTMRRMLVKLKETDTVDREEESPFHPFFQWVLPEKESKFEKFRELKREGHRKMEEKMAQWNMTGIVSSFFGVETGVGILDFNNSALSMLTTWFTILADPGHACLSMDSLES